MRASCFSISFPALVDLLFTSSSDFAPSSYTTFEQTAPASQQDATYLALHVLRIVLPVDVTCWSLTLHSKCRVAHLCRQSILQIQEARLANVLDLCACLADDGCFEAHAGARVPAEDGERTRACATRPTELLLRLEYSYSESDIGPRNGNAPCVRTDYHPNLCSVSRHGGHNRAYTYMSRRG